MGRHTSLDHFVEDQIGAVVWELRDSLGQSSNACPNSIPGENSKGWAVGSQTTILYSPNNADNARCHAIMSLGHANPGTALTRWTFEWGAPSAGTGDLTLFMAVVDGDHDAQDSLGDDTWERAIPLREGS